MKSAEISKHIPKINSRKSVNEMFARCFFLILQAASLMYLIKEGKHHPTTNVLC